jgi:Asp/Glu/hydantoin racemase
MQYVENRIEAAIAGHAVLDALATHMDGHDAAIVAAFGDPGLGAAREFADIPVFGIEESALLIAWTLGRRISIVCLTPRLGRWYQECAEEHGLAGRLVSVRALDVPIPDITRAKAQLRERLLEECNRAIEEDKAEVIIFGGAPIAGLAREAALEIPVPTLDGVSCAVRLAEAVAGLHPRSPSRGSFARPLPKPAQGLSPALMRRILG